METERFEVRREDGRRLEVELAGPEDGDLLVFHNGTPVAGMVYGPMVEAGAARGIRHLTYSRPGYGDSDRAAGRRVADCAADVEAIADAPRGRTLLHGRCFGRRAARAGHRRPARRAGDRRGDPRRCRPL